MIEFTSLVGPRRFKEFVRTNGMGHLRTAVPRKDFRVVKNGEPWIIDNGKFAADRYGKPWNGEDFLASLRKVPRGDPTLRFVVVPDIVEGGNRSLALSIEWREVLESDGFGWMPFALAVQDGMDGNAVIKELRTGRWAAIFVGGSKPFKYETLWNWVDVGHRMMNPPLWVHCAGLYSPEDLAWARARCADSVDSTGWARNDRFRYVTEGRALLEHQSRISEAKI